MAWQVGSKGCNSYAMEALVAMGRTEVVMEVEGGWEAWSKFFRECPLGTLDANAGILQKEMVHLLAL